VCQASRHPLCHFQYPLPLNLNRVPRPSRQDRGLVDRVDDCRCTQSEGNATIAGNALPSARFGIVRPILFDVFGGLPFHQSSGAFAVVADSASQPLERLDQRVITHIG
jgi:hypothetical protein